MSEQERITLFERIGEGILKAQRNLYERKAKLGETVIIADSNGQPREITAEEALRRMNEPNEHTIRKEPSAPFHRRDRRT